MTEEIKVDRNLVYLSQFLSDLDYHKFDEDIIALINELKFAVYEKLYSNFNLKGLDIQEEEMYIRYKLRDKNLKD